MKFRGCPVLLSFVVVFAVLQSIAQPQPTQAAPPALPQDPLALMTLGQQKNGLGGADIKPWHMRGTFHFYKDGKPEYEGIYEEWWFSPARYKLSFTSPKAIQTDYATGNVLLRDGTQDWLAELELLRASLIEPLPGASLLTGFTLKRKERPVGKGKLECVSMTYPVRANLQVMGDFYPAACFESSMPVLRVYSTGSSSRTIYDQFVQFQGHYVARKIEVFSGNTQLTDLTIETIEGLKDVPETVLVPSTSALPVDLEKIAFKSSLLSAVLRTAVPEYPDSAKGLRIQGKVDTKAIIGVDGHVEKAQVIDGPAALQQAGLDAVRQWVYRPFVVMGQPRQIEIEIHTIFSMGQ
jgi:TonB family protein